MFSTDRLNFTGNGIFKRKGSNQQQFLINIWAGNIEDILVRPYELRNGITEQKCLLLKKVFANYVQRTSTTG